jgi:hypothetical protein
VSEYIIKHPHPDVDVDVDVFVACRFSDQDALL